LSGKLLNLCHDALLSFGVLNRGGGFVDTLQAINLSSFGVVSASSDLRGCAFDVDVIVLHPESFVYVTWNEATVSSRSIQITLGYIWANRSQRSIVAFANTFPMPTPRLLQT